ncbi:hypothetical protein ADUPG1_009843, partial [Aduncisulcus paluster]
MNGRNFSLFLGSGILENEWSIGSWKRTSKSIRGKEYYLEPIGYKLGTYDMFEFRGKYPFSHPQMRKRSPIVSITFGKRTVIVCSENGIGVAFSFEIHLSRLRRLCFVNSLPFHRISSVWYDPKSGGFIVCYSNILSTQKGISFWFIPEFSLLEQKVIHGCHVFRECGCITAPGFVEWDELQSFALTFTPIDQKYRVWDTMTFSPLYRMSEDKRVNLRMSNGYLLIQDKRKHNLRYKWRGNETILSMPLRKRLHLTFEDVKEPPACDNGCIMELPPHGARLEIIWTIKMSIWRICTGKRVCHQHIDVEDRLGAIILLEVCCNRLFFKQERGQLKIFDLLGGEETDNTKEQCIASVNIDSSYTKFLFPQGSDIFCLMNTSTCIQVSFRGNILRSFPIVGLNASTPGLIDCCGSLIGFCRREDFICQDLSTIASRSDVIPPESDHSHSVVISDTYCSPFFDSSSSSDSDATGSTLYSEIDEGELV